MSTCTKAVKQDNIVSVSRKKTKKRSDLGVSYNEHLLSILYNPATYELAEAIADPDPTMGGVPKKYPKYLIIVMLTLADAYSSARRAFTEIHGPGTWKMVREAVVEMFPDDRSMHLLATPPTRSWYVKTLQRNAISSLGELAARSIDAGVDAAVDQGFDIHSRPTIQRRPRPHGGL